MGAQGWEAQSGFEEDDVVEELDITLEVEALTVALEDDVVDELVVVVGEVPVDVVDEIEVPL